MSHIKSLINNLINGQVDEAGLDLHNHIKTAVQKLVENPVLMTKHDILKIAAKLGIEDPYLWEIKRAVAFDRDYSREDLIKALTTAGLEHFAEQISDEFYGGPEEVEDRSELRRIAGKILSGAEGHLDRECRYKDYEFDVDKKTVEWVTQESDEGQSQEAAETIAKLFTNAGLTGWTIKVVVRDEWDGEDSPWQTAQS